MSSKNDDTAGFATALALVAAGMYFLAIAAAIFFAIVALVLTVLSIMAWNRPLRVHKIIITPREARGFVWRGVTGLFAAPLLLAACQKLLGWHINWDYLLVFDIVGYCIGSIGVGMLLGEEASDRPLIEYLPPEPKDQAATPVDPAVAQREPFRFASWDDEER